MMQQNEVKRSHSIESALHRRGYMVMSGACHFPRAFLHRHTGLEIALFHAGVAQVALGNWRGSLLAGNTLISAGDVDHGAQGAFSRTVLHFTPDLVGAKHVELVEHILYGVNGYESVLTPDAKGRFVWVAQQLRSLPMQPGYVKIAESLIDLVMADVEYGLTQNDGEHRQNPLNTLLTHMHLHPESGESVQTLAKRFGFSRSHLARLFETHVGEAPGTYWLRIRLNHACTLLQQPGPIEQVATRVGFQSVRGFQRAFFRLYGMTPAAYRELGGGPVQHVVTDAVGAD